MSKLRNDAAQFLRAIDISVRGDDIQCASGHWKKEDCFRWEFRCRETGVWFGCWLTLTEFVKECRLYGGATRGNDPTEIYPNYPTTD